MNKILTEWNKDYLSFLFGTKYDVIWSYREITIFYVVQGKYLRRFLEVYEFIVDDYKVEPTNKNNDEKEGKVGWF